MRLVIFDVDGTLTATNDIDSKSYETAVAAFLRLPGISSEWSRYPEVTDAAIFEYLCREQLARKPTPDEIRHVQTALVACFQQAFEIQPEMFAPVPGAPEFIRMLQKQAVWAVALATGAWGCSARFKLAAVGLADVPLSTSDSAGARHEIVCKAMDLGCIAYGQQSFDRTVLVGDALWDLSTARRLNLPFVGVASGKKGLALEEHGASHVVPDFQDPERVIDALERAHVPMRASGAA